jgi:transposase
MIVIGADTHKRTHALAAVDADTGQLFGEREIATNEQGHLDGLRWARELGHEIAWAIEDCRHVSQRFERSLVSAGERFQSDAHFARMAGVAPVPASSGRRDRHRLHRGGNRQLNRAVHIIAITRGRLDPETRAYLQRKEAEGKSPMGGDALSQASPCPQVLPAAQRTIEINGPPARAIAGC